jgi:hypothetical protein
VSIIVAKQGALVGPPEQTASHENRVCIQEGASGCSRAIFLNRLCYGVRPSFGQLRIELLGTTVALARPLGASDQTGLGLDRAVTTVEHPGNPKVLLVADPARETLPQPPADSVNSSSVTTQG